MFETIAQASMSAAQDAGVSFATALTALAAPALLFAALAFAVSGVRSLGAARAASGEIGTNFALYGFDLIVVSPLLAIAVAAAAAWLQRSGLIFFHPADWSALPRWLVIAAALFIGDFVGYWRHRLEHTALLWPAHAVHHSDTRTTWTTLFRFHPINRFSTALIDSLALALIGVPPWAIAINNLVRHYYGMFIHMDLPWSYGPIGRVLVSPVMHRWHHVRDADGAGANFATLFSVFDQAFRTYHAPGPCGAALGVRDDIGQGPLAQLYWPFRVGARAIAAAFGRRRARSAA